MSKIVWNGKKIILWVKFYGFNNFWGVKNFVGSKFCLGQNFWGVNIFEGSTKIGGGKCVKEIFLGVGVSTIWGSTNVHPPSKKYAPKNFRWCQWGLSWGSSVHRPGSEDPHRFNNINWKKVSKIRWNGEIIKMYFSILHSAPFNFQPYSRGWNTWKKHFWFWNIITTRNRNITTWNRICLIDSSFSCLQMPRTQISCPFQINLAKNNIFKAFLAFGPFLLDRDPRARTPINTSGRDMQDCFHLKNHSH